MSVRKVLAKRKPGGRLARTPPADANLLPPAQVKRLLDASADGLRDPVWSSQLGRLHLAGKLNASQLAAGKRWAELVSSYSQACQGPRPPRTKPLDAIGGTPADPDSEKGAREVRRHERATASYLDGRHALRLAGPTAERVVESVCIHDQAPAGFDEMNALRSGLSALSTWWGSSKRKPR